MRRQSKRRACLLYPCVRLLSFLKPQDLSLESSGSRAGREGEPSRKQRVRESGLRGERCARYSNHGAALPSLRLSLRSSRSTLPPCGPLGARSFGGAPASPWLAPLAPRRTTSFHLSVSTHTNALSPSLPFSCGGSASPAVRSQRSRGTLTSAPSVSKWARTRRLRKAMLHCDAWPSGGAGDVARVC
ncbi:hypothetical protein DMC30DRAFT_399142 [Rhodotorula diobovata]|uniref:Uncharacterized protein n=1 Tax=Rhodotorula diobovata TaxID=5288 RepID=A0A5C5FTF2_9BASI|nr:hypothetical protein DMC30DRAFT_399142 [Rhodotorula diobovata]